MTQTLDNPISHQGPDGSFFLHEIPRPDAEAMIKDFLSLDWERAEGILDDIEQSFPDDFVRIVDNLRLSLLAVRNGVETVSTDEEAFGDLQVKNYLYDLLMDRRAKKLSH